MVKLSYAHRQALPDSDFAIPEHRAYPIDTPARARNALSRVSQFGSPSDQKEVCGAVADRYPGIHAKSCMIHRSGSASLPSGIAAAERGR
jgi:hypothetical protein